MVTLTRLTGSVFALNSDLIERVDCTPDTVITLVDGTKYLVRESLADVVEAVRSYRGSIVASASQLDRAPGAADRPAEEPHRLAAVPSRADAAVVPFPHREA